MRRQWSYLDNLTFHLNNMAKLSMIERERKKEKNLIKNTSLK